MKIETLFDKVKDFNKLAVIFGFDESYEVSVTEYDHKTDIENDFGTFKSFFQFLHYVTNTYTEDFYYALFNAQLTERKGESGLQCEVEFISTIFPNLCEKYTYTFSLEKISNRGF